MTTTPAKSKQLTCPSCDNKAKQVSTVTLGALLVDGLLSELPMDGESCSNSPNAGCTPVNDDTGWRFCDSTECDVVYFSVEGHTAFTKSQLKVPVGVKEKSGDRPLCYCFGHSVATIKEELRTKGSSDALTDIRQNMKAPGCQCETENPSGACCLGNVTKGIQVAKEELGMGDTGALPRETNSISSSSHAETIAKVGAVVSAIVASSCCWLPLVLLAVGVSGAGIASTMEAYRPLLIVVTFSFLAAAFYYTYRPKKSAIGGSSDCCPTEEVEDCCSPAAKRRFNMMGLNKVMLWGVTVLAVAFLLFPSNVGVFLGGDIGKPIAGMNRAVFAIEGMTCEGCSAIAGNAIRGVPGVLTAEVSYIDGEAVVGTEACCTVPSEEILTAIERAGYRGTLLPSKAKLEEVDGTTDIRK